MKMLNEKLKYLLAGFIQISNYDFPGFPQVLQIKSILYSRVAEKFDINFPECILKCTQVLLPKPSMSENSLPKLTMNCIQTHKEIFLFTLHTI